MSWKDNLLDASYREVPFQVMADGLDVRRALAQHGMPYRDGDTVEDLGREARRFELRAVFYGADYELGLQALLAALNTPGSAPLVHPVYGHLTVMAERWQVRHQAERPDYAEVQLALVEDTPDPAFFKRVFMPAEGAMAVVATSGPDWRDQVRDLLSRVDSLSAQVQTWIGGGYVSVVEQVLDLPGVNLRLMQLRSQARGVLVGLADIANAAVPTSDPLELPARVPVDMRSLIDAGIPRLPAAPGSTATPPVDAARLVHGGGVSERVPDNDALPGASARAWQVVLNAARRGQAPALKVAGDPNSGLLDVPAGFPSTAVDAQGWALANVGITGQALALASAVAEVLGAERQTPTLTPPQLARLAGQSRALIEGAILMNRRLYAVEQARDVIEPLRNVAALIQAAAQQVIVMRPPLIERTVATGTCLRLLAFRWYGDNARALELLRLNPQLSQPYDIATGEVLHAYAE